MKIVIVGADSSGISMAKNLRALNSTDEIVLVDKLTYMSYSQSSMPYYISGELTEEDLLISSKEDFQKKYNIDIILGTEVISINPETKELDALNTISSSMFTMKYDKLVLAIGTIAKKLNVFEGLGDNIFIHRNLANAKRLKKYLQTNKVESALIVGSGLIAFQLCETLNKLGMDVYLLEKEKKILPRFDQDIAEEMKQVLDQYITVIEDANIIKAKDVSENSNNRVLETIYTRKGKQYSVKTNIAIVCVGDIPATKFISKAGINVDENSFILVDEYMQTNIDDIYAVGDAIKVKSIVEDVYTTPTLASPSKTQAKIASNNILGHKMRYKGSSATKLISAFGYLIGRTGLTEKELKLNSIDYYNITVIDNTTRDVFKNAERLVIKGIFSKKDGRLLGASAIGKKDVARKIDVLAACVKARFTALDLEMLELTYMPKYNIPFDLINQLGQKARIEYEKF